MFHTEPVTMGGHRHARVGGKAGQGRAREDNNERECAERCRLCDGPFFLIFCRVG